MYLKHLLVILLVFQKRFDKTIIGIKYFLKFCENTQRHESFTDNMSAHQKILQYLLFQILNSHDNLTNRRF